MDYTRFKYGRVFVCGRCRQAIFNEEGVVSESSGLLNIRKLLPGSAQVRGEGVLCKNCGGLLGSVKRENGDKTYIIDRGGIISVLPEIFGKYFKDAIFACGCFWGVEYQFKKVVGIVYTRVGYCGGTKHNPSYEEVKSGTTGHKEAVHVLYDPRVTNYERLVRVFFEIHDFTQKDGQGPDIGSQYLSYIFYLNDEQRQIAEKYIGLLKSKGYDVATRLERAGRFWIAEDYHQDYYGKTGNLPYCHVRRRIFD
ncbi:MAG TPA: peptide-methionine (S)-S-oxide reductase [Candidatus Marinimicrobia bacterium]|nr:peptide-methionine (S)-S-oxide reductase [Candidatus Neomarinimicrobiota bacterium]